MNEIEGSNVFLRLFVILKRSDEDKTCWCWPSLALCFRMISKAKLKEAAAVRVRISPRSWLWGGWCFRTQNGAISWTGSRKVIRERSSSNRKENHRNRFLLDLCSKNNCKALIVINICNNPGPVQYCYVTTVSVFFRHFRNTLPYHIVVNIARLNVTPN